MLLETNVAVTLIVCFFGNYKTINKLCGTCSRNTEKKQESSKYIPRKFI